MLVRMANDAKDDDGYRKHYETVASAGTHPVIVQTYNGIGPMPSMKLMIDLARRYPRTYGWFKVEGSDKVISEKMAELVAAQPVVKTVFTGWGGRDWLYQYRRIGTRGVISQRPAYAGLFKKVYDLIAGGRDSSDPELASTYAKYLYMINLGDTFSETDDNMRGPHLYVLQRLGIFRNRLTRDGKGKVTDFAMTEREKLEVEQRMRYCGLLK